MRSLCAISDVGMLTAGAVSDQAIGGQRFGDVVSPAAYAQIGPAFVSGDRSQKTDNGIGDPVSAESGGLVYAIAAFCCLLLSVSEFFLTSVF